jgi:hypothetical protein
MTAVFGKTGAHRAPLQPNHTNYPAVGHVVAPLQRGYVPPVGNLGAKRATPAPGRKTGPPPEAHFRGRPLL